MLNQTKKQEQSFKLEQEREHDALVAQAARFRELRSGQGGRRPEIAASKRHLRPVKARRARQK